MPLSAVTAKSDANHVLMRIDRYARTPPVIRRSNHAMDIAMDVGLSYRVAINISVGNSPAMPKPTEWRRSCRRSSFPEATNAKLRVCTLIA